MQLLAFCHICGDFSLLDTFQSLFAKPLPHHISDDIFVLMVDVLHANRDLVRALGKKVSHMDIQTEEDVIQFLDVLRQILLLDGIADDFKKNAVQRGTDDHQSVLQAMDPALTIERILSPEVQDLEDMNQLIKKKCPGSFRGFCRTVT